MSYKPIKFPAVYLIDNRVAFNTTATKYFDGKPYIRIAKSKSHISFCPSDLKEEGHSYTIKDKSIRISNSWLIARLGLSKHKYYPLRKRQDGLGYCIRLSEGMTESEAKDGD